MSRLGTSLLLVCSSVSPDAIDDMGRVAADLHDLGELAQAHGVTVGFEALCWGRHINDYRQAWEAVRRADHAHVGLILDTFHALARKCPVEPIAAIPGERIVLVQTADAPGIEMDLLFLSRHYRCFPGQGDLPVVAMMRQVGETGYRGPISHEIFSDDFRAGSARQVATDGMRSFRLAGGSARRSPPLGHRGSAGVEFVELVDDRHHSSAVSRDAAGTWLPAHPPPSLQGGRAASPGRDRPRAQSRGRGLPQLLPAPARPVGGRPGAAGRRCRRRRAPCHADAGQAVHRTHRRG